MKIRYLATLAFMFFAGGLFAQEVNLQEKLKTDPEVRIGTLDNGMTYYIRHNETPKNRVELELAVKAGAILETEAQRGLAHFTEHMAFNGTKHFEKNEMISALERMGIRFGAELNAATGFDKTFYTLSVPLSSPGILDTAMLVLEDWANNVTMDGEEIDKERGVIEQEWRGGQGASDRMRKKSWPIIFKGSRYSERIPIGLIDVIRNHHHDTLRAFYKTWYRPNLQGLVVVGDIDVDQIEKKIKERFSQYKNPENAKERKIYSIPDNEQPLVAIVSDVEAPRTSVQVYFKRHSKPEVTLGDLRESLKDNIYSIMLSTRFSEIAQKPNSPFNFAYSSIGEFIGHNLDTYGLVAMAKEGKAIPSLKILLEENERVKRF
ncbi:MAG: M16 family metallopeptidase, partial [Bacteroidales bacterium]